LILPHNISKTDAARITELDTDTFHDESWKVFFGNSFILGVKRKKIKVMRQKKTVPACAIVLF